MAYDPARVNLTEAEHAEAANVDAIYETLRDAIADGLTAQDLFEIPLLATRLLQLGVYLDGDGSGDRRAVGRKLIAIGFAIERDNAFV